MRIMAKTTAVAKTGKIKETGSDLAFDIVIHILAALAIIIALYPLIYVVSASFSSPGEVMRGHVVFFPKKLTLDSYKAVIHDSRVFRGYKNTIFIAVVGTAFNLIATTFCAYPLSLKNLPGKNVITVFITFTMFFSAGMIPNYLLMKELNLLNTYWVLLVPGLISVYNMLVMRNFFQNSIPGELIEAATIDGCGNLQTLFKIVLPLSKAIIAVMFIFYLVGHWNAYFDAMMYISDKSKYPLQLVLRSILLESASFAEEGISQGFNALDAALSFVGIQYAIIVLSSLPVMIMYPFMQKYFVQGVMIGAVKG